MVIESAKNYILVPDAAQGIPLASRTVTGEDLLNVFTGKEAQLDRALDNGTTIIYKGNSYYLDEALDA